MQCSAQNKLKIAIDNQRQQQNKINKTMAENARHAMGKDVCAMIDKERPPGRI